VIAAYTLSDTRVSAIQWLGDNVDDVYEFVGGESAGAFFVDANEAEMWVPHLKTWVRVNISDFIVKDMFGAYIVLPSVSFFAMFKAA